MQKAEKSYRSCIVKARSDPSGEAGIGIVIKDEKGTTLTRIKKYLGTATNNVAEYTALIHCLETIVSGSFECDSLVIHTDSELMARQIDGTYKIKDQNLKVLHARAKELMKATACACTVKHIPRSENTEADMLANEAIDTKA